MIYITTTEDIGKNSKNIASMTNANDTLYILYSENNASIPIEAFQLLSSIKCKVEFKTYPIELADQFKFIYELGIIRGEHKNEAVRLITDVGAAPFLDVFRVEKPARKKRSVKQKNLKKEEEFMPAPEIPIEETKKSESKPATDVVLKKPRSRKDKPKDDFDQAYDQLTALLNEAKTKTFDPTANLYGIVKAVKASIADKVSLEESFKIWFPNNSDKFLKAFAGKENELTELVSKLNDEI